MSLHPVLDLSTVPDLHTYLASTPFASRSIEEILGGSGNYTFRLRLEVPHEGASTVILKHAKPYIKASPENARVPFDLERQKFEADALQRVRARLPDDAFVTVPRVHLFDDVAHVIIMDDCGDGAPNLKQYILDGQCTPAAGEKIGTAVGEFVAQLHDWGKEDASALEFFHSNEQAKRISSWAFYGRLVSTVDGTAGLEALQDPPLVASEKELSVISQVVVETTQSMMTAKDTVVMGDLWPGNILISADNEGEVTRIYVIDWELAKSGLRGVELGQFCAEMHNLRRFHEELEEPVATTISSFLRSYIRVSKVDTVALARATLSHVGTHLVILTPRIPWGGRERVRDVVEEGIKYLVQSGTAEVGWLAETLVAPLLAGPSPELA